MTNSTSTILRMDLYQRLWSQRLVRGTRRFGNGAVHRMRGILIALYFSTSNSSCCLIHRGRIYRAAIRRDLTLGLLWRRANANRDVTIVMVFCFTLILRLFIQNRWLS